jgi:hypothetical protein
MEGIVELPLKHLLLERTAMLRYMYIYCIVVNYQSYLRLLVTVFRYTT